MAKKIVQPVEVQASVAGDQSVKSFKAQLREAQQEALRLAAAFGETDARTRAAAQRVAELKDRMDDVNATIAGLHPDRFQAVANITSTMANGFAAAQGAAALLGTESEDLEKQMVKVQGAMAFAQGISSLKDIKFQFASLGTMITGAVVPAFNAMRAALGTAGLIGLFVAVGAAIVYVISNFKELTGQLSEMEKAQARVRDTMREAAGSVENQRLKVEFYRQIINDTTKSEDERRAALEKLKELVPTLADNEIDNANALAQTNTELNDYIQNAILRAQIDALIAKRAENNNKISEATANGLEKNATLADKATAAFQAFATGGSYDMLVQANAANSLGKSINDLTLENQQLDKQLEELESQYIKTEVKQDKYKKQTEKTTKAKKDQTEAAKTEFQVLETMETKGLEAAEETQKARMQRMKDDLAFAKSTAIDFTKLQDDIDKQEADYLQKKLDREKAAQQARMDLAINGAKALITMLDALRNTDQAKTEEQAKRQFEASKRIQIAETLVSTFAAAQKAYQSQMAIATPDAPIRAKIAAGIAIAEGLARVAMIKKQQFTFNPPSAPSPAGSIPPLQNTTASALAGGAQFGQQDTRVYVTEGDISQTQRRVRVLKSGSRI